MAKSTHQVEVVEIVEVLPHPNADKLGVVNIHGFTCCVGLGQYKAGDLAAYVQPDSVVDTSRPEFSFLGDRSRIRVKKLRGVISQGLLVPAPPGAVAGDDVAAALGVTRYDPPENMVMGGDTERPPAGYHPAYDVENYYRYNDVLGAGEHVIATEKIHGANGRWLYDGERMWAGSRTTWKKEGPAIAWWKALSQNPSVEAFCREHPGMTVYGEVYGRVQDLRYGKPDNEFGIAVFDVLRGEEWVDMEEVLSSGWNAALPWAPTVFSGAWSQDIVAMADGQSLVPGAGHIREGIVVKPMKERTSPEIGRVQLKIVSNAYLEG